MPSTIQNFFATIDPISPPSEMHGTGCIRGGGAGYCPRVCPQSVVSFSAIVLRPKNPICLMRPGPAQSVRDRSRRRRCLQDEMMTNSEDRPPPAVGAYWINEGDYPALLEIFADGNTLPRTWK